MGAPMLSVEKASIDFVMRGIDVQQHAQNLSRSRASGHTQR